MRPDPSAVAILGFHDGAAGQVASWFEEVTGLRVACFVLDEPGPFQVDAAKENKFRVSQRTEYPVDGHFKGRPFLVTLEWGDELKRRGITKVLPLTPDNRVRLRQLGVCRAQGLELVSAIHPTVTLLEGAVVQPGVWINAGALIGYRSEVASGVILNTRAQVDHHNVLGACCQLDPAVVTAGNVALGECCHLHTGVVVINRVRVGPDAIVGAEAVLVEDVPDGCTVVGVPGRIIKRDGVRV